MINTTFSNEFSIKTSSKKYVFDESKRIKSIITYFKNTNQIKIIEKFDYVDNEFTICKYVLINGKSFCINEIMFGIGERIYESKICYWQPTSQNIDKQNHFIWKTYTLKFFNKKGKKCVSYYEYDKNGIQTFKSHS